jgi:hypothetical protein
MLLESLIALRRPRAISISKNLRLTPASAAHCGKVPIRHVTSGTQAAGVGLVTSFVISAIITANKRKENALVALACISFLLSACV